MGTEQRKVYEMLTGLRSKSREQKLNDAFAAMDNFMKPPKHTQQTQMLKRGIY